MDYGQQMYENDLYTQVIQ